MKGIWSSGGGGEHEGLPDRILQVTRRSRTNGIGLRVLS